jgi:uncharacterized membrane protein YqiK
MKRELIALLAAGALVGCNDPVRDQVEQNEEATQERLNAQKEATEDAAEAARERVDAQNETAKARITAQERAQQAQIEANKEKAEAQAEAQKEILDAQEDAAHGTPGAVQSGTATDGQQALADQTFHGRVASVNSAAGTLAVTDTEGRKEFKLENKAMMSRLKAGETVTVKFHRQNGTNIVDSIDVADRQQPSTP